MLKKKKNQMGRQSTWVVRVHGSVSVSVLLLELVQTCSSGTQSHHSTWVVIVHGSSEYMGRQSTWVVRVHGSSEYMGRQSTGVVIVHGSSEYMGRQSTWVSISKCPTLRTGTDLFKWNPISS